MNLKIHETNTTKVAQYQGTNLLQHTQDFLDLLGNGNYHGAYSFILGEENLTPDFFKLSTGLAGEVLQKFSTYNQRVAIVGNFEQVPGKSLKAFMAESNRMGRVLFVKDVETALLKLGE